MIKNIIFDFDGVIADSEFLVAKAFSQYLKKLNINFSEKEFAIYAGKKTFQVIDELSLKFNIQDKKKFFNDIMNIAHNIYNTDLESVYGSKNFLENNSKNIFIGSNSVKDRVMIGLKKIQFHNFFDEDKVFTFDLVEKPKPYPDIYLKVINTFHLIKNETVIIEDSTVGVEAGVAAGIKVIGFTAGKHWHEHRNKKELTNAGAYVLVSSYKDLTNTINNL